MALRAFCNAFRQGVLQHVGSPHVAYAQASAAPSLLQGIRKFADFLDKKDVEERVIGVVKNFDKVDPAKVSSTSQFQKDLGLDSLDVVEVVMAFEEEFQLSIPDNEADKILSVTDAVNYVSAHPQAK